MKNKVSIWAVLIMVVLALITAGFFLLKTDKITPSASKAGWSTYSNKVHKYSVEYPSDWSIDTSKANEVEDFTDNICCDHATLIISNGQSNWTFNINRMYTGFEGPAECMARVPGTSGASSEYQYICSSSSKRMEILGYPVVRSADRLNSTGEVVEAQLHRPGECCGFGQIGVTPVDGVYTQADQMKYFIEYGGKNIAQDLETLDSITESIKSID